MSYRDWGPESWADDVRRAEARSTEPEPFDAERRGDDIGAGYEPPYAPPGGGGVTPGYVEAEYAPEELPRRYAGYRYGATGHDAAEARRWAGGRSDPRYGDAGYAADPRHPGIPAQRPDADSTESWVADLRAETYSGRPSTPRGEGLDDRAGPVWAYPDAPARQRPARRYADDSPPGGYGAALLCTAGWFGVPLVLYTLWTLTLDATADPRCIDGAGEVCASDRTRALTELAGSLPKIGAALLLSLFVAIVLRWASSSWRAVTVGFAAAVVGSGAATVIFSVLSGEKLG